MADFVQEQRLEAERAVIGSMLIDSAVVRDALATVDETQFSLEPLRIVFQAIRKLFRDGKPVDAITVHAAICDAVGKTYPAGGAAYSYSDLLASLIEITPTSANWAEYARIMHEQATLQRVRELVDKLKEATSLEDCRPLVATLAEQMSAGRKVEAWDMQEIYEDFLNRQESKENSPYIRFGFEELDKGTYVQLGHVLVIGGQPSAGKTALGLVFAYHMAASYKVGFFSLETDNSEIGDRMIASSMQISYTDINHQAIDHDGWTTIAVKGPNDFVKRDFTVIEASGYTVTQIQTLSQAYGFDIVFIDYVQLIRPETDRRTNRTEQMASVSRALKTFARSTKTLVVELAQLARPDRSSSWREPEMHDLKESGQFEADADLILLLFRPKPKEGVQQEEQRLLKVAKNKKGRWGTWPLHFDGAHQSFYFVTDADIE